MPDMFAPTRDEKIAELEKELKYRLHVYPRLIAKGTMRQVTADRRNEVMAAILADYTTGKVNAD